MTRSVAAALLVFGTSLHAGFTPAPAAVLPDLADALQPFAFLLGNWTAAPGASGETGAFSFTAEVQGQTAPRPREARFESEPTPNEPRYLLRYTLGATTAC